jgi:cystathionine beta-lyase
MVSSAGKSFAMPGLIDSFIYTANDPYRKILKNRIEKFHLAKSNAFANTAWQIAYEHGDEWLENMLSYLQGNIAFITDFLQNQLTEIKLPKPEGTYQIWLDFRSLGMDNDKLAKFLATEAKIALNPGYTYGPGGDGFARMNIASPLPMIKKGMEQLKDAIDRLD